MKHGWTGHGAPCCALAPVAQRPDEVTACGGPNGHSAMDLCVLCGGQALMLHLDGMQVPNLFDEAAWRLRQDTRLMYQGVRATSPFDLITNITITGIS